MIETMLPFFRVCPKATPVNRIKAAAIINFFIIVWPFWVRLEEVTAI